MATEVSTETSTKVLFVRVDEALHRDLKMSAVASRITLQGLVESILRQYQNQQVASGATATLQLVMAPPGAPAEQQKQK
jgi:hypothetical protein